jgi:hypothetical protein
LSIIVPEQKIVNNQIKCSITDYVDGKKYFVDEGDCFPIQRSRLLYFVFNEIAGNGEIIAYYTHRPLVPQRDIYGILLGVSGGVVGGGGAQYPAAAKAILRYIGKSSDDVKDNCMLQQVKLRIIEAEKVKNL